MKYRLVRVLGQILGLGWSQLNLNVITGVPHPTADDYAGFPLMHAQDPLVCVPISLCYYNADQPKMDDRAALARLYPVTNQNTAPVSGATVQWSAPGGAGMSACNGATTCSVLTDESGWAETRVTPATVGASTITATLAPASYTPPKYVQATVSGTASAKDLAPLTPRVWVTQGATIDIPFRARLQSNGLPLRGQTLNWQIALGSGSLNPTSGMPDGNGYAQSVLHVSSLAGDVQGTVCLAPANNPCQTFYVVQVQAPSLRLQPVSGGVQTKLVGNTFQPITVRVTNSATPANPVAGVP